jgi:hypothetical protein
MLSSVAIDLGVGETGRGRRPGFRLGRTELP